MTTVPRYRRASVEDPMFAKLLCAKIDVRRISETILSELQVTQIPAGFSSDSNLRRVECKKVKCSWYKPSRTTWLNFGNEEIAKRVFNKFNSNSYRILDQTAHCNQPTRSGGLRNPYAWTLMLTDLSIAVTENDIRSAIRAPHDSPRNIELGKPTYNVDGELASATVMSFLSRVGPIEWSQANTELEGKRAKAIARFYEEADAREAVASLHNVPLPFGKNMKLSAQLISTAKFKVATTIFSAVQTRIRTASQGWTRNHLSFKVYPCAFGFQYRVLKIEGPVAKDVAAAKETMDEILDGIIVMSHNEPCWSPSLSHNGIMLQKLKKIQRDYGVVIIRNRRKVELRLYGSPEKCVGVELAIADMVSIESSTDHIINLNPEDFQWVCNSGFPLRIVRKRELNSETETTTEKEDCVECWTQAENPNFTRCGHVYCIDCFEGLCTAAGSGEKDFSISCVGDKGQCQVVFSLEELQENVSSKAFEDILEASFASHVQRHPQTFRYCPKPGCDMIYRTSSTMKLNTCAKCFTMTCTSCHAGHEGKTCAEYKDEISGGYEALRKLKMELGIKDCPKCTTPLEKTEGCNHMMCRGCRAHLCWVCMEVFAESGPCYDHMTTKHGGIGLEHLNHI
ncbi:ariadne RING finger, putative [Talaromyces stipitatus ATCC 10500]|uniref:Ariadne RING finger, putative n=1 Tax=Talaromyces stipitatus (strain ATCC 10500 / CBS 375.48 / QM 6759 / NRRL 1006) TaxID=441959 RepID=B8MM94_TALSN|nr:ariadne RING finger, putative [Talaromyces stipitatus ATCC 10500]EED13648.1 ariadne RING finger, putative [Talaromyces stipitatus ATCC 10500]